ncbi:MAG: hypothetical protein JWP89_4009 [Schlesneria sp.]|nr:hypothetical protein [Schlesneria sp.]
MQTFFHGWRRKTGIVTLAMACVFQIALIRGSLVEDVIRYDISGGDYLELRFEDCGIECGYQWNMWIDTRIIPPSNEFNWVTFPVKPHVTHRSTFQYYDGSNSIGKLVPGHIGLRIPDLPAVAILTAIAAYLLLRKPNVKLQPHA